MIQVCYNLQCSKFSPLPLSLSCSCKGYTGTILKNALRMPKHCPNLRPNPVLIITTTLFLKEHFKKFTELKEKLTFSEIHASMKSMCHDFL